MKKKGKKKKNGGERRIERAWLLKQEKALLQGNGDSATNSILPSLCGHTHTLGVKKRVCLQVKKKGR